MRVLRVTVPEATNACKDDKLWARLKSGIDGAVHRAQTIWDTKLPTEDWGFLLIDSENAFNYINQIGMLSTVSHLWTSRARFILNFYYHWSLLILRNGNGTGSFLHSREGMTQGDPLAMVAYGIGTLPPIKTWNRIFMKSPSPDVTQPWYPDNAGALGTS